MKKLQIPLGILGGICCLLLALALGLAFIHLTGIPYRLEPFTNELAMQNYRAVMRFLSPFVNEPFSLPSLPFSADGARHFADCKPLFNGVYILGLIGLAGFAALLFALRKQKKRAFWLTSGITTLAAPAALLLYMAVDFDRVFILFHKVFFNNDLWLFDPKTDPIINLMPESFFMHCAVLLVSCVILAAAAQLALGFIKRGKPPQDPVDL